MPIDTDKIMNQLAGEIVLLDEPEIASLKKLMEQADQIKHKGLAKPLNVFKTLLLDAATGMTGSVEETMAKIKEGFKALQQSWEKLCQKERPPAKGKSPVSSAPAPAAKSGSESLQDDPELLAGFIQEAREHLDSIEVNILEWEANPQDKELINAIFRPFHTIKGTAGFLHLNEIQNLAHELENLLDAAREGKLNFSRELADLILKGVDLLMEMTRGLEVRLQGKPAPPPPIGMHDIISQAQAILMTPTTTPEVPRVGAILLQEKMIEPQDLQEALRKQAAGDTRRLGEILIDDKHLDRDKVEKALGIQARKERDVGLGKILKVDTVKMDALFDMVGELVITHNMLMQNKALKEVADRRAISDLAQLKRITGSLQIAALSMRMVPISATFQKMRRVVYDLAQKSGKKINLKLTGETTEFDRNLVESLYDPLIHMVRNACDHGIESPEARLKAGKDEAGLVSIEAYQKGSHIYVEVRDDGVGMDRQKIRKKALEKGMITENEDLDEQALIYLIFRPGFSTAESVSSVSGRGVGMDVVKRAVARMGGRIEVHSELGWGSTFTIKFPLTLAIIDGVVVTVGSERYIIPTIHVKEALRVSRSNYNLVAGRGETILIRERVYPLIRIHEVFNIPGAKQEPWEAIVVIVETEFREMAILVDEIVGKQEVVIKNLGEKFHSVHGVSGGAILGDGRIGLILDVNQIETSAIGQ